LKVFIKNMVSQRCKLAVIAELEKLGLRYVNVELGEVEVNVRINPDQRVQLKSALMQIGLELIDDTRLILVEKIKNAVVEMVHYSEDQPRLNFSDFLSGKIKRDYTYLANVFSETTGNTIEHFIIAHKIERVKEFLVYDELNVTEIAYKLHYSSVAHLSNQFKKETGLTPTEYKNLKYKKRTSLENV
jgi:AraC-like DNA-binding protein